MNHPGTFNVLFSEQNALNVAANYDKDTLVIIIVEEALISGCLFDRIETYKTYISINKRRMNGSFMLVFRSK